MPYLVAILITLLPAVPAMSVELFRYRGAAKEGGTLEYVFEGGEQNSPNAVTKEKAAEIAAEISPMNNYRKTCIYGDPYRNLDWVKRGSVDFPLDRCASGSIMAHSGSLCSQRDEIMIVTVSKNPNRLL
jgi:hypothetical protein